MKHVKKVAALVLALVMALSLNLTVYASGAAPYVVVTIQPSDGSSSTFTMTASAGETMQQVVNRHGTASWREVADYYDSELTHDALISFEGKSSTPIDITNAVDQGKLQAKGYNYANITWYDSLPGYGLISYDGTNYTYIYAGYDWTYSSNLNAEIWSYMCCYTLSADEVVQLNYGFNVSVWTSQDSLV
jgi:hypothetical protein